jgi:hypothetical protein
MWLLVDGKREVSRHDDWESADAAWKAAVDEWRKDPNRGPWHEIGLRYTPGKEEA